MSPRLKNGAPINMVLTLLSVRWLGFRNTLLRSEARERNRVRLGLLLSIGIIVATGAMAYSFFGPFARLAQTDDSMKLVLVELPAFSLFAVFWMLLLSGITVGIQRFYLNQEMGLLLVAPVSPRAVFAAKFVEATLSNAGVFLTIGAPVLFAYGMALGSLTPPFILHLLIVLVAFSALPTGIGLLLSFLLMRVLPVGRTRDVLGALGITVFAALYFLLSVSMTGAHDADALRQGTARFADVLTAPIFRWGPWAWAGSVFSGRNPAAESWQAIGLLSVVALAGTALTGIVAHWVHFRGWANAQEAATQDNKAAPVGAGWEIRLGALPGPVRAILLKDFRSLRRDLRQLSLLLIPVAVVAVFLYQTTQTQFAQVHPVLLALGLFPVFAMISLRLAMSGFVGENRAMWVVMAAPNEPRTVLFGKFFYAYSLSLALSAAATIIYGLIKHFSSGEFLLTLSLAACVVAGFSGIGVGASAIFSDFEADNPRITVSAAGRLVTFFLQMLYLTVLVLLIGLAKMLTAFYSFSTSITYLCAGAAVILLSMAFVLVPMWMGAGRLRRLEW